MLVAITTLVRPGTGRCGRLRAEDQLLAAAGVGHELTQQLLGDTAAVDAGGVHTVAAGLQVGGEDGPGRIFTGMSAAAEGHRLERQHAHPQAGRSEQPHVLGKVARRDSQDRCWSPLQVKAVRARMRTMDAYRAGEAAAKSGFSLDTLRYYERAGLYLRWSATTPAGAATPTST